MRNAYPIDHSSTQYGHWSSLSPQQAGAYKRVSNIERLRHTGQESGWKALKQNGLCEVIRHTNYMTATLLVRVSEHEHSALQRFFALILGSTIWCDVCLEENVSQQTTSMLLHFRRQHQRKSCLRCKWTSEMRTHKPEPSRWASKPRVCEAQNEILSFKTHAPVFRRLVLGSNKRNAVRNDRFYARSLVGLVSFCCALFPRCESQEQAFGFQLQELPIHKGGISGFALERATRNNLGFVDRPGWQTSHFLWWPNFAHQFHSQCLVWLQNQCYIRWNLNHQK